MVTGRSYASKLAIIVLSPQMSSLGSSATVTLILSGSKHWTQCWMIIAFWPWLPASGSSSVRMSISFSKLMTWRTLHPLLFLEWASSTSGICINFILNLSNYTKFASVRRTSSTKPWSINGWPNNQLNPKNFLNKCWTLTFTMVLN